MDALKKYSWLVVLVLVGAMAVKVFYPHLWGWPLLAITSIVATAATLIVPQFSKLRALLPVTLVIGWIFTTTLAFSFWPFWAGIPLLVAITSILALLLTSLDKDMEVVGVAAFIAVNTIIVWRWAAGSDIRWSLTIAHVVMVFLVPVLLLRLLESFKEPYQ